MDHRSGKGQSEQPLIDDALAWVRQLAEDRGWPDTDTQIPPPPPPSGAPLTRDQQVWHDAGRAYTQAISTAFEQLKDAEQEAWEEYTERRHKAAVRWDQARIDAQVAFRAAIAGTRHA